MVKTPARLIQKDVGTCRKCGGSLFLYGHGYNWVPRDGQGYYFENWHLCSGCKSIFNIESSKKPTSEFIPQDKEQCTMF
jgi:hypothetical protein